MRFRYLLLASFLALAGVVTAPTAAADCTTSGNTTLCSLGEGDDADADSLGDGDDTTSNRKSSSLPFVPYPCEYDYYCNEGYNWFTP